MRRPLLFVALLLLLGACRDQTAERFAHARASYDALLARAERPSSPAFDAVLKELESIPPAAPHGSEARRMAEAIRGGRMQVRAPLALAPKSGSRPPELEAILAACARLAVEAGLDGGVDPRALEALEACRRRAEVLDIRFAHGDEPDGGRPHE